MRIVIILIALATGNNMRAQTNVADKQVVKKFEKPITKTVKFDYLLYLPDGYDKSKKDYPMIMFLHGACDCGGDISQLKKNGIFMRISKDGSDVKFTIYPEANHNSWTETYKNPELYSWFLQHTNKWIK